MNERVRYIGEDGGFPNPLEELQDRIGYRLNDQDNLHAALTHPSYWGEYAIPESERLLRSYERLEFLGDSVIALTICTRLFNKFPEHHQGILSKHKGHLVSKKVLLRVARRINIGNYIRVGKGVSETAGRDHSSFMVDCLEALIGAVYIEAGFEPTSELVARIMKEDLDETQQSGVYDYKTTLQEIVQKKYKRLPQYKLVSEAGPEHQKVFTVEVFISGDSFGEGEGHSKKEAEISAAKQALERMNAL